MFLGNYDFNEKKMENGWVFSCEFEIFDSTIGCATKSKHDEI